MKVAELRELLDGVPGDIEVILFDREGDGFTPDAEISGQIEFKAYDEAGNEIEGAIQLPSVFALIHPDANKVDEEGDPYFSTN